jgi:Protein of unknown function (DUF1236)
VLLAAILMTSPAAAQTTRTVEPSSMPLSAEKQAVVKEHVRRAKVSEAQADGRVTVGMIVPEEVELWALPQDSVTEVPTVTSYKFVHAGKTIAVVDPEYRKAIQVIPN